MVTETVVLGSVAFYSGMNTCTALTPHSRPWVSLVFWVHTCTCICYNRSCIEFPGLFLALNCMVQKYFIKSVILRRFQIEYHKRRHLFFLYFNCLFLLQYIINRIVYWLHMFCVFFTGVWSFINRLLGLIFNRIQTPSIYHPPATLYDMVWKGVRI